MFHKFCAFMVCAGFFGVAVADSSLPPQVVTSEVFYDRVQEQEPVQEPVYEVYDYDELSEEIPNVQQNVPVWPLAGSEADVELSCGELGCANQGAKISGVVIENNVITNGEDWSGGPNIMNNIQIPAGFDYECANGAEMPLMRREMMEDDGGTVLAMSRSARKNCNRTPDSYAVFAERAGFSVDKKDVVNGKDILVADATGSIAVSETYEKEVAVNESVYDEESSPVKDQDQVRSWVVVNGQTLREVLKSWCDKEGWDLVWTTPREYPIEASAVFKGRFIDVASALIRNFERATPIPYAKFYKGNRVIVVSTTEE